MWLTRKKLLSFSIFGFLLISVFFPGDPYKIKLVFFFLAALLSITRFPVLFHPKYREILIMGIVFPIILILLSIIQTGNIADAITGAYPAFLLYLVIVAEEWEIPYEKHLMLLLKIMAYSIIVLAALDFVGLFNVNGYGFIRTSFYKYDMGMMGKSHAYSTYYRIYYKASALLVILLYDSIKKNKRITLFVTFIALLLSGTRANFFSAIIILAVSYLDFLNTNDSKWKVFKKVCFVFLLTVILVSSFDRVEQGIKSMMSASGSVASDGVRSMQIQGLTEGFSDLSKLFFGSGFGSEYYNYGRGEYQSTAELAYINLLRQIGLIMFLAFLVFLFRPLMYHKLDRKLRFSYFMYLVIAYTNPLLYSSTAYVLYIYMRIKNNTTLEPDKTTDVEML